MNPAPHLDPSPVILIVDDHPGNRDLMGCVVEATGYRAVTAGSGDEAMALARRERPSLVISDVLMRGTNGFELGRALRTDPGLADVPLILWTAHYDTAEVRRMARSLDIACVLPKPCDNAAVQAAIADVLEGARTASAPPPPSEFEREQLRVLSDKLVQKADELDRARGELRDSQNRFDILVSNIPGAIYRRSVDDDMAIELVSEAIEQLTGHADGRTDWRALIHPDDRAGVAEQLAAARAGDHHYSLAYRIVRADGEIAWIGDRGQVVTAADGANSEYGILSDITARKRLEAENARMETGLRLAHKLEAVGQLAAGVAHEINTPIQFVGDGLVFLRESFEDLETLVAAYRQELDQLMGTAAHADVRARLEQAEAAADLDYLRERAPAAFARTFDGIERVASIVSAMKEFAHPRTEQAPADINRALATALEMARSEYKYVAVVTTDLAELPDVVCNISDLNQVFLNLIINAAHALEDTRPSPDALGAIEITTRRDGDSVVITCADDGPGIPAEIQERIFDPFFTTKAVGRGSGQGLAIARAVVERHCGSLTFDTRRGAGTTFTVRLPIAGAVEAQVPA